MSPAEIVGKMRELADRKVFNIPQFVELQQELTPWPTLRSASFGFSAIVTMRWPAVGTSPHQTHMAPREYSYRLPVYLVFAGIVVAALLDLACPRHVDGRQITHPRARLMFERTVNATDQEQQEGYFAFGLKRELMWVVDPKSDLAEFLRAKVGSEVRVIVEAK